MNEYVRRVLPGRCSALAKEARASSEIKRTQKKNFLDITTLIKSIQRSEGNPDCFRNGQFDCNQLDCLWRMYCLEEQAGV